MKKLHVALCGMMASAVLLTGCGNPAAPVTGSEPEVIESTVTPTENTDSTETIISTESEDVSIDDSVPPEEGMVRSRFTNEWIDEDLYDQRPLAVMIPNESAAIPHYGLSEASILYEANVEGRMTRMMAIFEDYESVEKIGNIRSFREYYGYWAFEWDSIITSYGGTIYDEALRSSDTTDHLNGNTYQGRTGSPFYRSADRSAPHNAYINGTKVKDFLKVLDFDEKDRGMADETHYNFTTPSKPNTLTQYKSAQKATYVDMTACYPLTKCYFEYNDADGLYYRSQHVSNGTDGPHIDGANGEQLTFTNLIIQSCEYAVRDAKGYLWFQTIDSGRDAWYVTQGKIIKCTWEKESEYGATRYYDEDGNEITLNTGKTMVLIIEDGDMFDYE